MFPLVSKMKFLSLTMFVVYFLHRKVLHTKVGLQKCVVKTIIFFFILIKTFANCISFTESSGENMMIAEVDLRRV